MDELASIGSNVAVTSLAGASIGFLFGHFRSRALVSSFNMGTNWTLLAIPFFTTREAVLAYRKSLSVDGRDPLLTRDRDAALGSVSGGAVVGTLAALYMRGPAYILGGVLIYSTLAGVAQTSWSLFRHWRIQASLQHERPAIQTIKKSWKDSIWKDDVDIPSLGTQGHPDAPAKSDPVGDVLKFLIDRLDSYLGRPEWSSPLRHALDVDYRILLNMKIAVLEDQIETLKAKSAPTNKYH